MSVLEPEELGYVLREMERANPDAAETMRNRVRWDLAKAQVELEALEEERTAIAPKPIATAPAQKPVAETRKPKRQIAQDRVHTKYPPKLKAQAVRRVIQGGESLRAVAEDIGAHHSTVARWINATRRNDATKPSERQRHQRAARKNATDAPATSRLSISRRLRTWFGVGR